MKTSTWTWLKRTMSGLKVKSPIYFSYHTMFDEVVSVNNVYNSLIIFEGGNRHCANQFFGKSKQDSRVAQVFFITKIAANKESSFPLLRVKNITL